MENFIETKGQDRLDYWFGLSYSSFITIPRVLLDGMSDEWKYKLAELLEEYDETYDMTKLTDVDGTRVQVIKDNKLTKMPRWLLNYRHPDSEFIESLKYENRRIDEKKN